MISDLIFKLIQKFTFIKDYKIYRFIKTIIFPFVIRNISKFYKDEIDERLIIMGAFGGAAFIDNTKYLFEFLNKNSDYKLFWIAKLKKVKQELMKKNYKFLPFYSLKTIKLLRKAKYIFITHGFIDILPIKFSPKTTVIFTWHGTPIKNVDINPKKDYIYNGWGDIFRLNLRIDQYIDYLLTPTGNKREREILSSAFLISPKKILELGYPRNDILFNDDIEFANKLRKKYKIPHHIQRIILYAPTFRERKILKIPVSKSQLFTLNNFLKKSNSIFLVKGHMVEEKINFTNFENIMLIEKTVDTQELLIITDVLISDYSSIMLDFSLLMRPILVFPYDIDDYIKETGLNYNIKEFAPGPIVFNFEDLINALRNIDKVDIEYKEIRNKIRDKFNKFKDSKSTERILKYLRII